MRKILLTMLLLAAPRAALACPVCFGQSDSPMAAATNAGIWLMLGVVGVMLSAFASFFVYLSRRMKRLSRLAESGVTSARAVRAGVASQGTASC
jgi:beta-lactamase regulating signal transducer with metallopeptidase domain